MSQDTTSEGRPSRRLQLLKLLWALAFAAIVTYGLVTMTAPVAAQTNNSSINQTAPYYNNSTATVDDDAWFAGLENATMDDIVSMALRVGPYVIGTGDPVAGGTGYEGPLLLGLVVSGIFLGAIAMTPVGAAGSGIVALVSAFGLVEVGLAPRWVQIVILFLLGSVAAVVAIRAAR